MNCNCETYLGNPAAAAGGIGTIFSGVGNFITNSQELAWSAPECGKRPFFIGTARDTWNECAAKFAARQMPGTDENNTNENNQFSLFWQKNKTPILIGGAALIGLIIYSQVKK
jgi:hypothetical protein